MIKDFVYDGISMSSMGYVRCNFDSAGDLDEITTDSQRNIENLSLLNGRYQPLILSYEDTYNPTLSFCKDPCGDNDDYISAYEMRQIKRWLSPTTPKKLEISFDPDFEKVYWQGIFNVAEVWARGRRVGFNLTFYSNRPYGVGYPIIVTYDVTKNTEFTISDKNDEQGYSYPKIEFTCGQAGDFSLVNQFDGRNTVVKNCANGETITFTPEQTISSSIQERSFSEDFNWFFPRLWNCGKNQDNVFTSSLNGKIQFTYSPSRKVSFD